MLGWARLILCRYGAHKAAPGEIWNRGYFFTRCTACGADLVRTASGKWHVPRGQKVVWRERKPRGRKPRA